MIEGLDLSTGQLAAIFAIALFGGLQRGFAGFGTALMLAPVISLIVGTRIAIPAITISLLTTTIQLVPSTWREVNWSDQMSLSLPGCIGVPIGVALLIHFDPELMRRGISAITVIFALFLMTGWRYAHPPTRTGSAIVGSMGGVLSGAGSVGGPPVIAYLLAGPSSAASTRASLIYFFAFTQISSLALYSFNDLITWEVVTVAALTVPSLIIGTWFGAKLFKRADDSMFRRVALVVLLIIGVGTFFA